MECQCFTCLKEADEKDPLPQDPKLPGWWANKRTHRFIVCSICGNKRCPHAKDHRNACTNSNATGQPGSLYE